MSKRPTLSLAYHTKNRFFVASYGTGIGEEREIVDQTWTTFERALAWVEHHKEDYVKLKIHAAKLTGEVVTETTTVSTIEKYKKEK